MHIRPDQFASAQCRRLQKYAGATVLYFLSTPLLQNRPAVMAARTIALCAATPRGQPAFKYGRDPARKIALNPYKLAILLQ
jgi:hypothetical protein